MNNTAEFIEVIQQNESLIYKVTKVYTNTKEDAQDLYQEIVYQLCKSFGSFRGDAKISTWMYRIALNTAIAHLNKQKKRLPQTPVSDWLAENIVAPDAPVDERSETLFALVKQLNDIEKGIVLLYLEGKTYAEIALITGFTVTNVGTRLDRIKQKIRSQINLKK